MSPAKERIGLIAGNGRFPFLVLEAARAQGHEVVVAAIREEAFPEIESHGAAAVHWLSLGELSKLIETFKREGQSVSGKRDPPASQRTVWAESHQHIESGAGYQRPA